MLFQWGNTILLREYKNGERVNRKIKYSPTMYVCSKENRVQNT